MPKSEPRFVLARITIEVTAPTSMADARTEEILDAIDTYEDAVEATVRAAFEAAKLLPSEGVRFEVK